MHGDGHFHVQLQQLRKELVGKLRGHDLHVGGGSPGRPHPKQTGLPEVKAVRGDKVLCPHASTGYHVPREAEGLPAAGPKLAVEQRKALLAAERAGLYAQLPVVAEDIGLYTLQPWPGSLDTGGVDAEGDVLGTDNAVVALGDLAFQHPSVLVPDAVVLVVLGRDIDAVPALRAGTVVDKGKLVRKRGVEVVEEATIGVKDNALILRRGHGVVDVLVFNGLGVVVLRYAANAVLVHFPIGDGLLRRLRPALAGLTFSLGRCGFSLGQSSAPPFPVCADSNKNCRSCTA